MPAKKPKKKKRSSNSNPVEQWCAELNDHCEKTEATALMILIALNGTSRFSREQFEAILDSSYILGAVKECIFDIEVWFERQVNIFVKSESEITLPTGWLREHLRGNLTQIHRDLEGVEESTRRVLEHAEDNSGLLAFARSFMKGYTDPVGAISEAFMDRSWEQAARSLQNSLRRLERDASLLRGELSEVVATVWNNEIVPAIVSSRE